jgi:dTMP kinase
LKPGHRLARTGDRALPRQILDANGEVVLGLCTKCGAAEAELDQRECGRLIAFEGGEATGKSTQARLLEDALRSSGTPVVRTREPGGSEGGEEIRRLIVEGATDRWEVEAEAMLFMAARADHLARTIRPAFRQGMWVITDRFVMSSYAYQGACRGFGVDELKRMHDIAFGDVSPDLTIVLDLDHRIGKMRLDARDAAANHSRFERFGPWFHQRLRQVYLELVATDSSCVVVDANYPPEVVARRVREVVVGRFGK